jgi:hypothetical protein
MMRSAGVRVVALTLSLAVCGGLLLAPSSGARAAPSTAPKSSAIADSLTGQARADYDTARTLMSSGDPAGALVEFQAAYQASKEPRLLWSLADCEKTLRHYTKAIALFRRFLAETPPGTPDRGEAEQLITKLERFTVQLTLEVNEPGADIEIDDASIGRSPLPGPVMVDVGQQRIRARKSGYHDAVVTEAVGGARQQTVALVLVRDVQQGDTTQDLRPQLESDPHDEPGRAAIALPQTPRPKGCGCGVAGHGVDSGCVGLTLLVGMLGLRRRARRVLEGVLRQRGPE